MRSSLAAGGGRSAVAEEAAASRAQTPEGWTRGVDSVKTDPLPKTARGGDFAAEQLRQASREGQPQPRAIGRLLKRVFDLREFLEYPAKVLLRDADTRIGG
jgi:hypothetical protein